MDVVNLTSGKIKFNEQDVPVELSICPKIDCDCGSIYMKFVLSKNPSLGEIVLDLNVYENEIYADPRIDDSPFDDKVQKFLDSLSGNDLAKLFDYYWTEKARQSAEAPISEHPYVFDFKEIEKEGYMLQYGTVFPFADIWAVTIGSRRLIISDYHCLNPSCVCREAHVEFIDMESPEDKVVAVFLVDYDNLIWNFQPHTTPGEMPMPILQALAENQVPDFYRQLEEHHKKLRQLYAVRRSQLFGSSSTKNKRKKNKKNRKKNR